MCRRRTIEFYKTYFKNSENDNSLNGLNLTISETTWEVNINSILQQIRESVILECLLELLSDDVTCHEALIEGYVNLLWLCLKDSLENNQRFPIEEVNIFILYYIYAILYYVIYIFF